MYELVTPPATEPVSLQEAKLACDFDGGDRDLDFARWITAARKTLEGLTDRSFVATVWRLHLDYFPHEIELRKCPVTAVASVKYYTGGVLTTLDDDLYQVDLVSRPARIVPVYGTSWPTVDIRLNAVQVDFTAAGADERAKQAICVLVRHWFDNPSAVVTGTIATELPHSFRALATQLRWH